MRSGSRFVSRPSWLLLGGLIGLAIATPILRSVAATPPKVGDTLPDLELPTADGSSVRLSKMSAGGPLVLVVLRGFPGYQCPLCTAQFGDLRGKAKEFAAAKANVVLIYPGAASGLKDHAGEFVGASALPSNFRFTIDPDFKAVTRLGLRWNAPGETAYPSTFVLDGKRKVVFARVSRSHGDRASAAAILAALPR
ncbi:MAG: redoxin family protein [Capsulimonadales bacterium]|nr:redoxin family protein [Capsulimonadales bacterium]